MVSRENERVVCQVWTGQENSGEGLGAFGFLLASYDDKNTVVMIDFTLRRLVTLEPLYMAGEAF